MSNYQTPPSRYYSRPGRPHDYVYDPVYTTSSQKDFYKDATAGSRSGARIHLRPVYDSMFSELKRDVRIQACLRMPQPSLMTNFMPQYDIQGVPVLPMDVGPPCYKSPDVTGADRAIYAMKYLPQNFMMERNTLDITKASIEEKRRRTAAGKKRVTRGAFVSRGVQTDYRESEAQTDPYSPPYILPYPGAYPKVMALIKLTWGNGLPATLEDIVVIERALERRLLETAHRNMKDEADFEKRVKLMEELEAQRWADREKELQKILEQKLDVTYKLLSEMYNKTSSNHTIRLERLHDFRRDEANKYIQSQKNRYIREIRKMEDLYLGPKKTFKRDIIKDYTDFNSQMYAPFLRNGRNTDMLYRAPDYEFDLHHNFEGLNRMITNSTYIQNEMYFDIREFSQKVRRLQPPSSVQRLEKKLLDTFHSFRAELEGKSKRANKYDEIIQKAKQTIPTDYQLDKEEADCRNKYIEEKDIASVTLQKIARGRIIQEEVKKGLFSMRAELTWNMTTLTGMKAMYDMDPHGLRVGENTHPQVLSIRQERDAHFITEAPRNEILNQLEGETLSRMLDFLDKEMVRLLDERKIHSLLLIADRERRMREACEAGKRQHEEQHRRANDEIFRQTVGIHQSTVDLYLEEIYLESINRFADENSREYVQKLAEALNQATYAQQGESGEYEREEMAAEHCFIMPELNRIYNREAMSNIQRRYEMAAEQVTEGVFNAYGIITEILQDMGPVLGEHLQRGAAAIDGSQLIVDRIIQNAVLDAMKYMRTPSSKVLESAKTETKVVAESESKVGSPKKEADCQPSKSTALQPKDPQKETKQSEDKTIPAPITEEDPEKVVPFEPLTVVRLDDVMKGLLGLKSVEVTYDTEVCKKAQDLFDGACTAVQEIFEEVKTTVVPPRPRSEFSDQELNSEDD